MHIKHLSKTTLCSLISPSPSLLLNDLERTVTSNLAQSSFRAVPGLALVEKSIPLEYILGHLISLASRAALRLKLLLPRVWPKSR